MLIACVYDIENVWMCVVWIVPIVSIGIGPRSQSGPEIDAQRCETLSAYLGICLDSFTSSGHSHTQSLSVFYWIVCAYEGLHFTFASLMSWLRCRIVHARVIVVIYRADVERWRLSMRFIAESESESESGTYVARVCRPEYKMSDSDSVPISSHVQTW